MKVRIYRPAKAATQSGRARAAQWVLEYELKAPRRPEGLMGWTAAADTLNQVRMQFESRDAAVAFAQAEGWDYTVNEPQERRIVPRSYTDNFRIIPAEGQEKA